MQATHINTTFLNWLHGSDSSESQAVLSSSARLASPTNQQEAGFAQFSGCLRFGPSSSLSHFFLSFCFSCPQTSIYHALMHTYRLPLCSQPTDSLQGPVHDPNTKTHSQMGGRYQYPYMYTKGVLPVYKATRPRT